MGRISLLRSLLIPASSRIASSSTPLKPLYPTPVSSSPSSPHSLSLFPVSPRQLPQLFLCRWRPFSSSPGPSNITVIKSEEEFKNSLKKAQDDSSSAIYYFTAVWCGPCKFISPYLEELSKKYPNVATYKIDVDEEGLQNTLGSLQISAVPTFHFFQAGKKVNQLIGADTTQLKNIMENLYEHN